MIKNKTQNNLVDNKRVENLELYQMGTYPEISENPRPIINEQENEYESIDLDFPAPPENLEQINRFELDEIEVLLIQALVLLCTILALLLFFFVVYNVLEDRNSTEQFYRKFPMFKRNYTNIMWNITRTTTESIIDMNQ